MNKLIFWLAFFVLFVASCSPAQEKPDEEGVKTVLPEEINQVKVTPLALSDFNQELIVNGSIMATNKVDLTFELAEPVVEIYVENGQRVKKGQKLASQYQFKLKKELAQAEDNLQRAKIDLQDILIGQGYELKDSTSIPKEMLQVAKVRSNYDNSAIARDLAKHNLEQSVLYAPFSGVVANLFSKQYNIPPTNEPFCSVISAQSMEADFMVLESELNIINLGDKVSVSPFSMEQQTLSGKIKEINPMVDENGMVRVKASISGSIAKLYDGMNVRVKIKRSIADCLVIPKEALVLRDNKKVVFTLQDNQAIWNYVQTGLENSTGIIITEGLKADDQVIYWGNLNLAHESPVELIQ